MTVSIPYPPVNGTLADGAQDNANFTAILAAVNNAMLRDGTSPMAGVLYLGGFKISNLGAPTLTSDAATMGYVTTAIASALAAGNYAPLASPAFTGTATFNALTATGAVATGALTVTGNAAVSGTVSAGGLELGSRDVVQDAQSGAYTLALADRAKHIYYTGAAAALTIPANATVAFPVGSVVLVINGGSGTLTLTRAGGVALKLGGTGTDADHPLIVGGMATLIKVATDTWYAVGPGLS